MNRWPVLRLLVEQLSDELLEFFGVVSFDGLVLSLRNFDEIGAGVYSYEQAYWRR